jgi:hypothetical protein
LRIFVCESSCKFLKSLWRISICECICRFLEICFEDLCVNVITSFKSK